MNQPYVIVHERSASFWVLFLKIFKNGIYGVLCVWKIWKIDSLLFVYTSSHTDVTDEKCWMPLWSLFLNLVLNWPLSMHCLRAEFMAIWESNWLLSCSTMSIYVIVSITTFKNLQVTATLTLAAACSSAGIIVLYSRDLGFCKEQHHLPCKKFQISVAFAFITWALTAISSHVMFWILLASV